MTKDLMKTIPALLAAVAAGACDGLADENVNGAALATIQGTMTLAPDTSPIDHVRLAIAWRPWLVSPLEEDALDSPQNIADAFKCFPPLKGQIVSQELRYEPHFPIKYRLDFTAPPPTLALVSSDPARGGYQGKSAVGILIAYQDQNGNGKLDACHGEGPCPDQILASSALITFFGFLTQDHVYVVFLDREWTDTTDPNGPVTFKPGYYLVGIFKSDLAELLLPMDTSVDLVLHGASRLQQLACEEPCHTPIVEPPSAARPPQSVPLCFRPSTSSVEWIAETCRGCSCETRLGYEIIASNAAPPLLPLCR